MGSSDLKLTRLLWRTRPKMCSDVSFKTSLHTEQVIQTVSSLTLHLTLTD